MATVRLTKKRMRALDAAISLDDILFEKFRRLSDNLRREEQRFYKAKQVLEVAMEHGQMFVMLPILRTEKSPHGMRVIVGNAGISAE